MSEAERATPSSTDEAPERTFQRLTRYKRDILAELAVALADADDDTVYRRDLRDRLCDFYVGRVTNDELRKDLRQLRADGLVSFDQSGSWTEVQITEHGRDVLAVQRDRLEAASEVIDG